jgi:glycine dehydrogenase subunit 2
MIFEKSVPGRRAVTLAPCDVPRRDPAELIGEGNLREDLPLPEVSELDVVRHYTRLSQRNYSIDTGFYPLGSCTMKYNPRAHEKVARLAGFARLHPLQSEETAQGALALIFELNALLAEMSGMAAVTIQPVAGAHGELLSLMMIHDYHRARGERQRDTILIPDSAHGTNPASAARCGFKVKPIPTNASGLTDLEALGRALDDTVAALMLTNPNTTGLFESDILQICEQVHSCGGLVYCDGANMNAILGVARPGDMGFDVMHFNLHKTFTTPHGGGGPGCGAVGVKPDLEPFLPVPLVARDAREVYYLDYDRPQSVGRIHSFYGNFLNAVRGYAYVRSLGPEGLREVGETAVLNANYIRCRVKEFYDVPHDRICMHEVVLSATHQKAQSGVRALDISKRLMDYGFHPPTNYFPLIIPEALMIEPTETESKQTLDAFCDALIAIAGEAQSDPEIVKSAPHATPISRLDETAAVKRLDVRWNPAKPAD